MCGRFTREFTWTEVHDFLDVRWPGEVRLDDETVAAAGPSWNVAPTQSIPVVRGRRDADDAPLHALVDLERWSFMPPWMRGGKRPGPINARGETVAITAMFRAAFARNRCIVPMSSFYEWQAREDGPKQPWRFHRTDGEILLVAGVRTSRDGEHPPTVALITTAASPDVVPMHDRMPLVLAPADASTWCDLRRDPTEAAALLRPAPDGTLARHPVSTRVNRPQHDDASLVEPVEPPEPSEPSEPPSGKLGDTA